MDNTLNRLKRRFAEIGIEPIEAQVISEFKVAFEFANEFDAHRAAQICAKVFDWANVDKLDGYKTCLVVCEMMPPSSQSHSGMLSAH